MQQIIQSIFFRPWATTVPAVQEPIKVEPKNIYPDGIDWDHELATNPTLWC